MFSTSDSTKLGDLSALRNASQVTEGDWENLLQYTMQASLPRSFLFVRNLYQKQVLSNLTNYKSFGFTKIVPRIPIGKFEAVIQNSANKEKALLLWDKVA